MIFRPCNNCNKSCTLCYFILLLRYQWVFRHSQYCLQSPGCQYQRFVQVYVMLLAQVCRSTFIWRQQTGTDKHTHMPGSIEFSSDDRWLRFIEKQLIRLAVSTATVTPSAWRTGVIWMVVNLPVVIQILYRMVVVATGGLVLASLLTLTIITRLQPRSHVWHGYVGYNCGGDTVQAQTKVHYPQCLLSTL